VGTNLLCKLSPRAGLARGAYPPKTPHLGSRGKGYIYIKNSEIRKSIEKQSVGRLKATPHSCFRRGISLTYTPPPIQIQI